MRVRAYVDGFNFYKGSIEVERLHHVRTGSPIYWKWLDVRELCARIARTYWEDVQVTYVGYFTAHVKADYAGDQTPQRQRRYLEALEAMGVEVVRGKFVRPTKSRRLVMPEAGAQIRSEAPVVARVKLPNEKGSDVNLATWLLRDFYTLRDSYDASIVVSNDGDLWHPVDTLRRAGWPVGVINPHGEQEKAALWREGSPSPHFKHRMTAEDLTAAPLPDPLVIATDGEDVHFDCPGTWRNPAAAAAGPSD